MYFSYGEDHDIIQRRARLRCTEALLIITTGKYPVLCKQGCMNILPVVLAFGRVLVYTSHFFLLVHWDLEGGLYT